VAANNIAANSPIGLPFCSAYLQLISREIRVDRAITPLKAIARLSATNAPKKDS